ncbi:uncharacterized protein LOC108251289 isoform X2 [Kryptolebias marmoratus]|uniref:uncharacterized protein LOC108251289 isoform X2 n=2 Tax=Kryptolebias marmoratus TaxID=37003 RepID=UPI0018AC9DE0|nr:uncharacterized protein LOC108251289 isoform X2 [Kryptolebias marmoratus]
MSSEDTNPPDIGEEADENMNISPNLDQSERSKQVHFPLYSESDVQSGDFHSLSKKNENEDEGNQPSSSYHGPASPEQAAAQGVSVTCPTCISEITASIRKSGGQSGLFISLSKKDEQKDEENQPHPQQAADQRGSVTCPACDSEVIPSINWEVKTGGQFEFFISLSKKDEQKDAASSSPESSGNKKRKNKSEQPNQTTNDLSSSVKKIFGSISTSIGSTVKVGRVVTGETFGADGAIMTQVMNNTRPSPQVKKTELDDCDIIIVFCPITCRVGSDVEGAMRDPKVSSRNKPIILVLMHHTRDPDYSTEGIKWSEVYKNVKYDVHVLFHETHRGLLKCKHNNQAIEDLQQELYKYKTKLWRP